MMTSTDLKNAIGVFPDRQTAEQAIAELRSLHLPMHQVSILSKDPDDLSISMDRWARPKFTRREGAKEGAIVGGVGIGTLTLAIGLGILPLPGIGPALALEGLLEILLGSGFAATVGGLYGALRGWLFPEEQAKIYSQQLSQGRCLITLQTTQEEILQVTPVLLRWGVRMWRVYL